VCWCGHCLHSDLFFAAPTTICVTHRVGRPKPRAAAAKDRPHVRLSGGPHRRPFGNHIDAAAAMRRRLPVWVLCHELTPVHRAVRNCTRDEREPFEVGNSCERLSRLQRVPRQGRRNLQSSRWQASYGAEEWRGCRRSIRLSRTVCRVHKEVATGGTPIFCAQVSVAFKQVRFYLAVEVGDAAAKPLAELDFGMDADDVDGLALGNPTSLSWQRPASRSGSLYRRAPWRRAVPRYG
jgi:hypothetical protein